ncbi:MAG TPA: LuxR C-terminal-related transcriptional regulator [Ktedonobacteraceae bacterium]
MPKRAQYTVSWSPERAAYVVTGMELVEPAAFEQAWLEDHRAFAFHGRCGQINLLKEKRSRGGEGYWYAYRRSQGQMVKRYVGRDEQMSVEQLEKLATLLVGEPAEFAFPSGEAATAFSSARATDAILSREKAVSAEKAAGVPTASGAASGLWEATVHPLASEPLLMPKLQLPRLQKGLLPRAHLLALLDQGLERKVTLVSAAAGYGKTTLLAQWIAALNERAEAQRIACVTLDEGDNDPLRFWRYVITACQKFDPNLGKEALALLLAYRLPPFQFKPLDMTLVALLNDLSQLEQPGVLILDDLHTINSPLVAESLRFFLEHLPAGLHVILVMRGDPPFTQARLRARNELLDVSPASLMFSQEETRAFLAQELSVALPPRIVRQLHQRLEGWPAGLRLFSRVLAMAENEQEVEQTLVGLAGNHWSLREYFLSEVLHTLPQEQQEFLLQTSVLPRVTALLCDALLGREDSAQLIESLRSGDFFLAPLDHVGEWMRYHLLFAETMQREARRILGDARLNQLALQASSWYEEHDMLAEAIETALSAAASTGDYIRVAGLITRFIEEKVLDSRPVFLELYSLKHWLESLPAEELERNPDFCLNYAMILLFTLVEGTRPKAERERIYQLLRLAEDQWRDANATAKLAQVFSFRALLARQEGRTLQALTWARQALAWLRAEDLTWRTIALTVVGVGEVLSGTLERAREALQEAQNFNELLGNATYGRATRGMLSWVYLEQGDLRRAAEQFRQMQSEARAQEDHDDIARTQLALAQLLYEWNELEESERAALEARELGEQIREEEFLYAATLRLAQVEQARGQSAEAQQRLTAWLARNQAPASPQSYQYYREIQAMLARIQLAQGDLAAVQRWYASLEQREEILPPYQRQREQLLSARYLLAQGEFVRAQELLDALATTAPQTGHLTFFYHVQIVLVLAHARQGQRARAREQLGQLLAATRSEGYLRLFLDEGPEMAELLRDLLPHLRDPALQTYTRAVLGAFGGSAIASPVEKNTGQSLLLEPLSSQEQKVLRLLVAGNSNSEIARELVVSINTVRTQVQSIYRKLDVNNRVQASALARELHL